MWVDVGMMLHHQYAGSFGAMEKWQEWSSSADNYSPDQIEPKWESFGHRSDQPITFKKLLKLYGQPPEQKPEPTPADKAFRFYSGDIYSLDFVGGPELVEDVLPGRGIAMMFGPSGKGKTFWVLDLAFHIHNGARWRDKDVTQGNVMYVAAEAGRGIKKRIAAIKAVHPEWCSPFVADIAPNLSSITSIEAVRDAALAAGSPAMVVVDTLSASFEGDDSSQQDVAKMMRNLKILSDDLQCLVVFVHHTTKAGESWRGSGVLFADVDAVLELVSEGEGAERKQWVTQRKHREGEDGKSYPFSLKVSEPLAFKPNGKPITSCTVEQADYKPAPKKEGRKSRSGDFETSVNYEKARHFLRVIQDMCGLEIGLSLQEDEVIEAIQKDKIVNPMEEPDYPLKKNIIPTLRTLAGLGKISKEGRNIRLC
jgi:KaiC/GvpD/RAD55 family RecA-like ATPase